MAAAFQLLPVEVNAAIAAHLSDADLCRFTLICNATHSAVNCDGSPVWRQIFSNVFDLHPGITNGKLKAVYQFRKRCLRDGAAFKTGRSSQEQQCLLVLRSLIVESFGSSIGETAGSASSKNVDVLRRFIDNHNILGNFLNPKWMGKLHDSLLAVQIMLMHFKLNRQITSTSLNMFCSQRTVYASIKTQPLFRQTRDTIEVNMPFVAHTLNLFQHYLTQKHEPLYHTYAALPLRRRIQPWRKRLSNGAQRVGTRWSGIYSFLEHVELQKLRSTDDDQWFQDSLNGEEEGGELQDLTLHFPEEPLIWPKKFEKHLHALGHPAATYLDSLSAGTDAARLSSTRTRAQRRAHGSAEQNDAEQHQPIDPKSLSFQFCGSGHDAETFLASGWLNPLPPQQGIPGWQRMTMMKFFVDPAVMEHAQAGGDLDMDTALAMMDDSSLWAYEGVVLPGGELMVGRWWSPHNQLDMDEDEYSGPFMFWCVDQPSS